MGAPNAPDFNRGARNLDTCSRSTFNRPYSSFLSTESPTYKSEELCSTDRSSMGE